jgi:hypothetical protein
VNFSVNLICDWVFSSMLQAQTFEHTGRTVTFDTVLGTSHLQTMDEHDVRKGLEDSDVVIMTEHPSSYAPFYPYNQCANKHHTLMLSLCRQGMHLVGTYEVFGHRHLLFVQPSMKLSGESGSWVTSMGLKLECQAEILRQFPVLTLRGDRHPEHLRDMPGVRIRAQLPDGSEQDVAPDVQLSGRDYSIRCRLPDLGGFQKHDVIRLVVTFDRHFVPRELGINDDTRELVVGTPKVRLSRDVLGAAERPAEGR